MAASYPGARFISTCVETISQYSSRTTSNTVHLHVRGDNLRADHPDGVVSGSSPRAWRQWQMPHCATRDSRFISTCVETMAVLPSGNSPASVHLHVRGDNVRKLPVFLCVTGSSPRAWRQLVLPQCQDIPVRFISTCVETMAVGIDTMCDRSVHLHVRGDNNIARQRSYGGNGSSPRAWRQCLS